VATTTGTPDGLAADLARLIDHTATTAVRSGVGGQVQARLLRVKTPSGDLVEVDLLVHLDPHATRTTPGRTW
jgi:hypothetical protein